MTEQVAKILAEYQQLSPEERTEVLTAISNETDNEKLSRLPFYIGDEADLKTKLQVGIDQADSGEFEEFNASDIQKEGRERLSRISQ